RGDQPVWTSSTQYNQQGRLMHERHAVPAVGHDENWSYHYDAQGRLTGAERTMQGHKGQPLGTPDTYWYAWRQDGSLAAQHMQGKTIKPDIRRDASGLPLSVGNRELHFGANRRLRRVTQDN